MSAAPAPLRPRLRDAAHLVLDLLRDLPTDVTTLAGDATAGNGDGTGSGSGAQGDALDQWQVQVQGRLNLQAEATWNGLNDGYRDAGTADPASKYAVLYWQLGPAKQHCTSCPQYAAGSPYGPPGSGYNELNATPGDGHTECGAACHCSMRYIMNTAAQQQDAQNVWKTRLGLSQVPKPTGWTQLEAEQAARGDFIKEIPESFDISKMTAFQRRWLGVWDLEQHPQQLLGELQAELDNYRQAMTLWAAEATPQGYPTLDAYLSQLEQMAASGQDIGPSVDALDPRLRAILDHAAWSVIRGSVITQVAAEVGAGDLFAQVPPSQLSEYDEYDEYEDERYVFENRAHDPATGEFAPRGQGEIGGGTDKAARQAARNAARGEKLRAYHSARRGGVPSKQSQYVRESNQRARLRVEQRIHEYARAQHELARDAAIARRDAAAVTEHTDAIAFHTAESKRLQTAIEATFRTPGGHPNGRLAETERDGEAFRFNFPDPSQGGHWHRNGGGGGVGESTSGGPHAPHGLAGMHGAHEAGVGPRSNATHIAPRDEKAATLEHSLFHRSLGDAEVTGLVGAPAGSSITVKALGSRLVLKATGPGAGELREVHVLRESSGALQLNAWAHQQGGRSAPHAEAELRSQIATARRVGIRSVYVKSVNPDETKLLTRMGFNTPRAQIESEGAKDMAGRPIGKLPDWMSRVQNLSDLLRIPMGHDHESGADWWAVHGTTPGMTLAL